MFYLEINTIYPQSWLAFHSTVLQNFQLIYFRLLHSWMKEKQNILMVITIVIAHFKNTIYLTGHNCGSPQYTSPITHWHETNKARGKTKTNTCKEQQDNKLEMLEQVRLGYGQPIYPYGCLMNKWVQWNTCRRHSGLMGSALISWSKALAFEPWPFSLCSVHGRDTSLIVFLFTHVQGNLTKCWEVACDGHHIVTFILKSTSIWKTP